MTENATKIVIILAHQYKTERSDLEGRAESASELILAVVFQRGSGTCCTSRNNILPLI